MTLTAAGFFYLKNPAIVNGSFLVLNISFSYFASSLCGPAGGWQYFLPRNRLGEVMRKNGQAIVCIAACVFFVMFAETGLQTVISEV
ncbi:hypothetical protein [Dickeya solani]|uniref:Uncharacterized protein n=1 Tax=Dickeya solani TaxID=1089444 RepID=A0ABU4EI17_9GAMM|nr:hypothetical protein [Dickeya solani]AUC42238.1 hypothetical protein D083_1889 [Dickeya solani RNS 08.23.3.1.A]MCA7000426.1 hypothetical protein [Dickeya solani]MDV7043701.1 hypothetical protein [Dickeya solani]MZH51138.1 hypothetical protein [Dickeya solani]